MTFTTFSFFLAGLAATTIPVAIHLLSKGKPKRVIFPALRFAQEKLAQNRRALQLKRLFLLLLRVATFLLLGLVLARPYVAPKLAPKTLAETALPQESESDEPIATEPETAGISGRDVPIATAIVVDTSVRMDRVLENQSLLERARATARAILDQTPKGSEIAILDGTYDGDAFQPDRFAAKTRLDKLEIQSTGRTVAQSTLEAIALVDRSELQTREIFVLTDSTQASWPRRDVQKLRKRLAPSEAPQGAIVPTLYFVDLGDDSYQNASIVDLALSAETVGADATLRIDVDVERVAPKSGDVVVEIVFFDPKKTPENLADSAIFNDQNAAFKRESQTISFGEGRAKRSINFQTSGLPRGTCFGAARIVGGDALATDDVRWFAVDVVDDWRLLVVAPEPTETKSLFLTQALAPDDLRRVGRAPFELDVVPYASKNKSGNRPEAPVDLASATSDELSRYRAIFLLDPPGLDEKVVKKLSTFVDDGGGLGAFLGKNANPIAAFQTPECVRLLGCKPTTIASSTNWSRMLRPVDYNAPLLASFRQFERMGVPWDALPVDRYWNLEEIGASASVVATFAPIGDETSQNDESNGEKDAPPALVENQVGRGLTATLATPISDAAQDNSWNALASGDSAWVFVVFADGVARRLASSSSSILNYTAGEVAALRSALKVFPAVATVTTPNGEEISTPADVERRLIRFPGTKRPGIYRVRTTPNKDGESIDAAFAVAINADEFDLSRYPEEDWARLWDGVPYKKLDLLATGKALDAARRGKESDPYAWLVVLLAALFIVETGVANRFYKK
ncbi:MAG: BatA domain-containing protein [Thermoguttaceae bacterium]|nr:BatA domain-containing protein [Thermoguttaceae bacterium]